jgi:predicted dinucleotide-binding enzyme
LLIGHANDDQIGFLGDNSRAIFGRSYAAEPDVLVEQLTQDEAIAEADTVLLTVPNQLCVDYYAHVIEAILKHVAPGSADADAGQTSRQQYLWRQ